ncbi:MAG: DNA mismatch repair endonuclease MutL, partial [Cellulosilyticaceae bacterium]
MSSIKILDNHTINKIAAGEVVERPASVVKELVENSIDAKASSITVEIKNGGIDFVRITDNGKGIPKDEVEIAFLRHATSKITSAEDLLEVLSLGFRGEALASIASVSQVELISKTSGELTGKRVEVVAGKLQASEEIACPDGTTFIMRHLFYNIPARKAFLKTAGTEASKIADYMYKLALAHPEISFKYIQNNKLIFNTPGTHDLRNCVLSLYGKEVAKNTIKVNYSQHHINLVGLLGKPSITRGNRNYEHFFINGRYIKSFLLQKAVEEAYKTLTM